MATHDQGGSRPGVLHGIASIGTRTAVATLRPFTGAVEGELERLLESPRFQAVFEQVLESDGAKRLIDSLFESGLFNHFVDRLLRSDGLWRIVDEVAASPAVTAAISQQGLGFADQVGDQVRGRSRKADDWLEQAAHRLLHRHPRPAIADSDGSG